MWTPSVSCAVVTLWANELVQKTSQSQSSYTLLTVWSVFTSCVTCYTQACSKQKMKNWVYKSGDCQVGASEPPECNLAPSLSLFTGHHSQWHTETENRLNWIIHHMSGYNQVKTLGRRPHSQTHKIASSTVGYLYSNKQKQKKGKPMGKVIHHTILTIWALTWGDCQVSHWFKYQPVARLLQWVAHHHTLQWISLVYQSAVTSHSLQWYLHNISLGQSYSHVVNTIPFRYW